MKFVCVVLTFAAVFALSAALRPPAPTADVACYAHESCRRYLGVNCFCEKPQDSPEGVCVCYHEPKKWDCFGDEDCIGHPDSDNGRRVCSCHREYYFQPKGQCVCRGPLLG